MSTPKKILLATTLLLIVAGVLIYLWYTALPPAADHRRMYIEQETILHDGVRDPGAWSTYTAFASSFVAELDRIQTDVENATGHQAHIDDAWADPDSNNGSNLPFVESARLTLERYVASDLHERLTDVLALPGLAPSSLAADGTPSFLSIYDTDLSSARTIAMAEAARLRHAINNNDPDAAANALDNVRAVNRIVESQPMLISLLVRIAITSLVDARIGEAFTDGAIDAETARALLPSYRAWATQEPARTSAHLRAEGAAMRHTLRQIYNGSIDAQSDLGVAGVRPLWINLATADEIAASFYADAADHLDEGPAVSVAPTVAWENAGPVAETRHAPLDALLPAADRMARAAFFSRSRTGAITISLAIRAHTGRTGAPPADLEELVDAGLLDELPRDPYDPDGRYRYRADDTLPGGYLLWSVGPDGRDDSGTGPVWPQGFDTLVDGTDALFPPAARGRTPSR